MVKATTLTNDLAVFVRAGGAVHVAGGTGTFSPANATAEAAYWQPFLSAAAGPAISDWLAAGGWLEGSPPLQTASPVGDGVSILKWFMGQGVHARHGRRTLPSFTKPNFFFRLHKPRT